MQALSDALERLLIEHCSGQHVRDIEAGAPVTPLWQQLHGSGFLDALVPEARGGAGLRLTDALALLVLGGKYAVPVPFAQTLMARAICAASGESPPTGAITLATSTRNDDAILCPRAPYGSVAEWVLTDIGEATLLLPVNAAQAQPTGVHGSLEATLSWTGTPAGTVRLATSPDPRVLGACLYTAQLAGAMERVLALSLRYANERSQFGRTIGKFQAIQHHLSVMAEQTLAARMAAQMSCQSDSYLPDTRIAAVGKARASEAAVGVAALAHAVHGAIGYTAEYDLQLYTRRLHEWRLAYGSEGYWYEHIGAELLAPTPESTLDFIRARLFPAG